MQMLSLADVVDAGHRGRMQKAQTQQLDRQNRAQGIYDAAGKRAQEAMQAELAAGGDQKVAAMEGATAFGTALLEAGDMEGYFKHEGKVGPLRLLLRQEAQQEFAVDKDRAKLMKRVYSTMPNGEKIVGVEDVRGGPTPDRGSAPTAAPMAPKPQGLAGAMQQFDAEVLDPLSQLGKDKPVPVINPGRPGDGRLGAPSGPDKLRVRVSKGGQENIREVDFEGFMRGVQELSRDPVREAEFNFKQRLADIEAAKQIKVGAAKSVMKRDEGKATLDGQMKRDAANNEARTERDEANNDARMDRTQEAARLRQAGSITLAQFRAANGGGGRGGSNRPLAVRDDDEGYTYIVLPNGDPKYVVGQDGKRIKSLNFQKMVAGAVRDVGRQSMTPMAPDAQRAAGELLVTPTKPSTKPAVAGSKAQATIDRLLGGN